MPARIVLVHDSPEFMNRAADAFRGTGLEVTTFSDPMIALDALEAAQAVDLLVTRIQFPAGKPNGISLVNVARNKRPALKALFIAHPEYAEHVEGRDMYLQTPVQIPDLVDAVHRALVLDGKIETRLLSTSDGQKGQVLTGLCAAQGVNVAAAAHCGAAAVP